MKLSEVLELYTIAAQNKISPNTLKDYQNAFRKFVKYMGDPDFESITSFDIDKFFNSLDEGLSKKTLLNHHVALSALWKFGLKRDLVNKNILHQVEKPKPTIKEREIYSPEEFRRMLNAAEFSAVYKRKGKRESAHRTKYGFRNKVIMMLLYDSGMRSQELCQARVEDIVWETRVIVVLGKGDKEGFVPFSETTARDLRKYLQGRKTGPIFVTGSDHRALTVDELYKTIRTIGERAGIPNANVHRFRHSAITQFLRNGGRAPHANKLARHASMQTTLIYTHLTPLDIMHEHEMASPVEGALNTKKRASPEYER